MHTDPPAWIFPVQACDSNYITLKQIQIIDTLVAKFRTARDATPQHDTFKTPEQASPNHGLRCRCLIISNSVLAVGQAAYLYHSISSRIVTL